MKKIVLLFTLFTCMSRQASAWVTKAEIESMMADLNTSIDQIATVYVNNVNTYYTDGTSKTFYDKYTKEKGNHCSMTENGIKLTYKPDGVLTSVFFIPFRSIITIDVGKDYFSISLLQ